MRFTEIAINVLTSTVRVRGGHHNRALPPAAIRFFGGQPCNQVERSCVRLFENTEEPVGGP